MKITLEFLKEKSACSKGVAWFKAQKETDAVKVLRSLIKDDKLEWANWLIAILFDKPNSLRYAVFAAECVIHIWNKKYPNDDRPQKAIDATKAWLENPNDKTKAAAAAAYAAAYAAAAAAAYAAYAAYSAAYAAYAAADAAAAAYAYAAAYAADDAAYSAYAAYSDRKKLRIKILEYGISLLEGK